MKKTLLIITLFIGLGNVNAQSDATLEETKEWLEIYGSKLIQDPDKSFIDYELDFDGNKIMISYLWTRDGNVYKKTISDFKSIKRVKYYPADSHFEILIIAGEGYRTNTEGNVVKDSDISFGLEFTTKENATKIYNALKLLYSFYEDCNPKFENKVELENKF